MHSRATISVIAVSLLAGLSTDAYANVIWPALVAEPRMLSVPVIVLGLALEVTGAKYLFRLQWRRALMIVSAVNAVSALLGVALIPLSGILWEIGPGQLISWAFSVGTFNPLSILASGALAAAVSTAIEGFALGRIFRIAMNRGQWSIWYLLNLATAALAFGSVIADSSTSYRPWLF